MTKITRDVVGGKDATLVGFSAAYDKAIVAGVTKGNHGTLSGGAALVSLPAPVIGTGRSYLGTGQGQRALCGPLNVQFPFAASAWIRDSTFDGEIRNVCGEWAGRWRMYVRSGQLGFSITASGGTPTTSVENAGLSASTWHQVGVQVSAAGLMSCIIDGVVQATTDTAPSIDATPSNMSIGAPNTGNPSAFNGHIDDLRVYARELSPAEWAAIAAGNPPADVTAHWDFDDNLIEDAPIGSPAGAKSMLFAGNPDYLEHAHAQTTNLLYGQFPDTPITVLAKVKPRESADYVVWHAGDAAASANGYWLQILANDSVRWRSASDTSAESTAKVTPGAWNTVGGMEISNTDRRAIINGVIDGTSALDRNPTLYRQATIGRDKYSGAGLWFDGEIREVLLWNRELTPQELLDYHAGTAVPPGAIVHHDLSQVFSRETVNIGTLADTLTDKAGTNEGSLTNFPLNPNPQWTSAVPPQFDGEGFSLDFDNSGTNEQQVQFARQSVMNQPVTYSVWFNARIIGGQRYILGGDSIEYINFPSGSAIRYRQRGTTLDFEFGTIPLNQWNNLLVQRDLSGEARAFLNGVESSSGPQQEGTSGNGFSRVAGWEPAGFPERFFDGLITEVRFYNRILSEAERNLLASGDRGQPPSVSEGLYLHYDFRDARQYQSHADLAADLGDTSLFPAGSDIVGLMHADSVYTQSCNITAGSGTNGVTFRAAPGDEPKGIAGAGTLIRNSSSRAFAVSSNSAPPVTIISDLDMDGSDTTIELINLGGSTREMILRRCLLRGQSTFSATSGVVIGTGAFRFVAHNCFFFANRSTNGTYRGIGPATTTAQVEVLCCSFLNNTAGAGGAWGVDLNDLATTICRNNVIIGTSGTTTSEDFSPAAPTLAVMTHNASGDGTASGEGSLTGLVAAETFVEATAGQEDLHLIAGALAIAAGTDLGSLAIEEIFFDIDLESRAGKVWDIGADQFLAPASLGDLLTSRRRRRRRLDLIERMEV